MTEAAATPIRERFRILVEFARPARAALMLSVLLALAATVLELAPFFVIYRAVAELVSGTATSGGLEMLAFIAVVAIAGRALSTGERQRVALARAILKDAPIVLLDEATAALDPSNEKLVQHALANLAAEKTLIVVAHRLSTIRAADQILAVDGGRIVQQGTHQDLLRDGGRYARFWAQRPQAAGWCLARTTSRGDAP